MLEARPNPPVVWDREGYFANSNAKPDCGCDDHGVLCFVQTAYKACADLEAIPPLRKELTLDELMALGSKAWFSNDRRVVVVKMKQHLMSPEKFVIYARASEKWQAGETPYHAATIGGTEEHIGNVWYLIAKGAATDKAAKELAERNA